MKSSSPLSAQCRSSKTRQDRVLLGDALEEGAPGAEELVALGQAAALRCPAERYSRASIQGRSSASVTHSSTVWGESFARDVVVIGLPEAGPLADHLAQRPEGDPFAVGRRATVVPVRAAR